MATKALKPWRVVAADWRGARVTAVDETTITLNVRAEQSIVRSYQIAKSLFLGAVVDQPCIVRIVNVGSGCDNYVIGEVRSAGWAGHAHTETSPNWVAVSYELTNESPYWPWTAD
jgi:hypothetical protein